MEWLLQKAIESSSGKSYSPQQTAEMLDQLKLYCEVNIDHLSNQTVALERLNIILFALIIGSVILNIVLIRRFEKRLKKLEK
jgi:hypothetical protein